MGMDEFIHGLNPDVIRPASPQERMKNALAGVAEMASRLEPGQVMVVERYELTPEGPIFTTRTTVPHD